MYQKFTEKLLADFEQQRDILVASKRFSQRESLYGIRNRDSRLYSQILLEFERIALNNTRELVLEIFKKHNMTACISDELRHSIVVDLNGLKHHIILLNNPQSINSEQIYMLRQEIGAISQPVTFVFLLKDTIDNRKEMLRLEYRFYNDTILEDRQSEFSCVLFQDFLIGFFGQQEFDAFNETLDKFRDGFHKVIGYQVTELCSPQNLDKLRGSLNEELKSFNYDSMKQKPFVPKNSRSFSQQAFEKNFTEIRKTFIDKKRYELLLSNADFAQSFLTSEWLYRKYIMLDSLDNTFIVAGYLKTIEQLLWDIIVLTGAGREIKGVKITKKEDNTIDKTLGALEWFIGDWNNTNLYLNSFVGDKRVIAEYLKLQIKHWRENRRNGYFHKHQLTKKENIDLIREETWCLYFLILGSLKLSDEQVRKISN